MEKFGKEMVGPWPEPPIPDMDSVGYMHPPWIKYPNLPRRSSGWRMGLGESYLESFVAWWTQQSRQTRLGVRGKYPEPQEWIGFLQSRSGS
jgi:hypothetical protein